MSGGKDRVVLAVIGAPHGVRGEVRIKTFTGEPMALGDYGPLFDAAGNRYEVIDLRPAGEVVVARLSGVSDRNAAEALKGVELFVERSALPDDLEEDEFYHADLVGLAAVDPEGGEIGKVRAVHDFGAGDVLELRLAAGGTALVPFSRAAVPEIDLAARRLVIDPLAAGLLAGEEDEETPR